MEWSGKQKKVKGPNGEKEREREEGKKEDDEEVPFQLIRLRVNASSCR